MKELKGRSEMSKTDLAASYLPTVKQDHQFQSSVLDTNNLPHKHRGKMIGSSDATPPLKDVYPINLCAISQLATVEYSMVNANFADSTATPHPLYSR